jgi:hypothetical protein
VTAYSPVFTTLFRYPIDKLAAGERVACLTPAIVFALTTPGMVLDVPVPQVDEVVARIPVNPVPITNILVQTGKNIVVTQEGVDLVVLIALVEYFAVVATLDLGRISPNGE